MTTKRKTLLLLSLRHGIEDARMRYVMTVLQDEDTDANLLLPCIGISPLHLAVGHESEDFAEQVVTLLLQYGANPNIRSVDGMTPLHVAAAWGRMQLVRLLLSCGGDPWLHDNDQKNAFHYAEEHHWKTREMLEKCQVLDALDNERSPKYKMSLAKVNLFTNNLVLQYQAERPFQAPTSRFLKSCATQTVGTSTRHILSSIDVKENTNNLQLQTYETGEAKLKENETQEAEANRINDAGFHRANPECAKFSAVLSDLKKNMFLKKDNARIFGKWRNSKVSPSNTGETANRSFIDELKERQAAGVKKHLNQLVKSTSKTKLVEDEVMVEVMPKPTDAKTDRAAPGGEDAKNDTEAPGGDALALSQCSTESRVVHQEDSINNCSPGINASDYLVISQDENISNGVDSAAAVPQPDSESFPPSIQPGIDITDVTSDSHLHNTSVVESDISAYNGSEELSPSMPEISLQLNESSLPAQMSVPINMLTTDKYHQGSSSGLVSGGQLHDSSGDVEAFYRDLLSDSHLVPSSDANNCDLLEREPSNICDQTSNSDDIQVVWENIKNNRVIPRDISNMSNFSVMSPGYYSCVESIDGNIIEVASRIEPKEAHATLTEVSTEEEDPPVCNVDRQQQVSHGVETQPQATSDIDSFVSASEDYIYSDEEEGVVLLERRYLVPQSQSSSSDVAPSEGSSPNGSLTYDTDTLIHELKKQGYNPGPIIPSTKRVYLKKLERIARSPISSTSNRPVYSSELERTLRMENWRADLKTYEKLEQEVALQFSVPDPSRRWREGVIKSSFCYLLLDPRITCNLPCRIDSTPPMKVWSTFLEAIFYVGKGKRSRPYSHLYQAVAIKKSGSQTADPKIKQILDIWSNGLGVVCLHVFQNVIPVEAYTREAAIIDALTLRNITNARLSEYYGVAAMWPPHVKKKLGVYLLHKAMCIFINEGERQLQPADIG